MTNAAPPTRMDEMVGSPTAAMADQSGTARWESEGGSLKRDRPGTLPAGVTAVTSVHYRVGPYSYSRLEDALAEHRRQHG